MKKLSIVLLALLMLLTACQPQTPPAEPTPDASATETPAPAATAIPTLEPTSAPPSEEVQLGDNLIPLVSSTFDSAKSLNATAWTGRYGPVTVSLSEDGYDDTPCLLIEKPADSSASYYTAAINLASFVTEAGTYRISFRFLVEGDDFGVPFYGIMRSEAAYSFSAKRPNGQFYSGMGKAPECEPQEWTDFSADLIVEQDDLDAIAGKKGATWHFCLHEIREDVSKIYIDDFEVRLLTVVTPAYTVEETRTWVATEMAFHSSVEYRNPLFDAEAEMTLSKGGESYTIPLFWDGGIVWRVRFVCPSEGEWTWRLSCTDPANTGLNGQTGTIRCSKYDGPLEIYKHGFVKTEKDKKYFVYDDGTPFFYLGDTHWGLPKEPLDQVETILKKRVEQGYTVLQSEPLDASFNVSDGLNAADVKGFQKFDKHFALIASYGLVHANAEFFFPDKMKTLVANFGGYDTTTRLVAPHGSKATILYDISDTAKDAIRRLARYWVARYSAYPVAWTLGQEVDNDFYWQLNDYNGHEDWAYVNNPYRYLATYLNEADPYKHPLSAHQEGASYTKASTSAFRDVEAHTWYAVQWSASLTTQIKFEIPRDFYEMGQGKPVVVYESRYCYLWTKNFGARVQGWAAFLNGMCGYGWGGQDTWYYLSSYDEDETSDDGVDTVTPEEKKAATWQDSLNYPSARQAGYMRRFLEGTVGEWYALVPRFDDTTYFKGDTSLYMAASNEDNSKIVVYFYNFSDDRLAQKPNATAENAVRTGTLKKLTAGAEYHYLWFNPVYGRVDGEGTFTASADGTWQIPEKSSGDMVLYVYK